MKPIEVPLSKGFKKQTTLSILAIILFGITYLAMLVITGFGMYYIGYFGVAVIAALHNLIGIGIGLGMFSMALVLFVFLIKFIFKSHKNDLSNLVEITPDYEPDFFKMIHEIADQVQTEYPKKVYLSPDVNAGVFYNSSFWSLLIPVKKNLHVGMGLINTVTDVELKAILAHEFGHFSQSSMKVGSYVYGLNNVIFNLLYDNESFDRMIQKWANLSGFFAFFLSLGLRIISGIQWILIQLYGVVNKSYMALSREMEFHADEIAVTMTGMKPLETSLLRMALADSSFQTTMVFFENKIETNQTVENVFKCQTTVMNYYAHKDNLLFEKGLPNVSVKDLNKFNRSKLVITDQWSSHPSVEDRISSMEKIAISPANQTERPASTLFRNIEEYQKSITLNIFKDIQYSGYPTPMSQIEFDNEFLKSSKDNEFSPVYNGYYDLHSLELFDLTETPERIDEPIENLFTEEKIDLVYRHLSLTQDAETLTQIAKKEIDVASFDYDGRKYVKKESMRVFHMVKKELNDISQMVSLNDQAIYFTFLKLEEGNNLTPRLNVLYNEIFKLDKEIEAKVETVKAFSEYLEFTGQVLQVEQIEMMVEEMEELETAFKSTVSSFLESDILQSEITPETREKLRNYVKFGLPIFKGNAYMEENLQSFGFVFQSIMFLSTRLYFVHKKRLLDYQAKLLTKYVI